MANRKTCDICGEVIESGDGTVTVKASACASKGRVIPMHVWMQFKDVSDGKMSNWIDVCEDCARKVLESLGYNSN